MTPNLPFRCSIIAILLTLSPAVSKGQEKNDPLPGAPAAVDEGNRRRPPPPPDHLVPPIPLTANYQISYRDQLRSNLRLDSPCLALMLVMPSFESEYSLLLRGDGNTAFIKDSKTFSLALTKSGGSIWSSMPWNNDDEKQKKVTVTTSTVAIDPPLAGRILELWNRMITLTRKPVNPNTGLDGTTIEFATAIGRGETTNPRQNSASLLRDLGETLVQYCESPEETRKERLKEINAAADTLESYLKDHPQEGDPKAEEKK